MQLSDILRHLEPAIDSNLTPPMRYTGGRPAVDFDSLYLLWKNSDQYIQIDDFLKMYGIDPIKRRTREAVREWRRHENVIQLKTIETDAWAQVRQWRAHQARQDYLSADQIRQLIERKIDDIKTQDTIKSHELVALAKACETLQRIQRLSLGLSTDNVGINEVEKEEDNTPTFIVEMEENGTFKTQRPRQVR